MFGNIPKVVHINLSPWSYILEDTYDTVSDQLSNYIGPFTLHISVSQCSGWVIDSYRFGDSYPISELCELVFVIFWICRWNFLDLQAARARLSSAEIALFIDGDPSAIDYRAASLQQQVQTNLLQICWQKGENLIFHHPLPRIPNSSVCPL